MKPIALVALIACTTPAPLATSSATASGTTSTTCPPTAAAPILEVLELHATIGDDSFCTVLDLGPDEVLIGGSWRLDLGVEDEPTAWWSPDRVESGSSPVLERADGSVGWHSMVGACDGITARVVIARAG